MFALFDLQDMNIICFTYDESVHTFSHGIAYHGSIHQLSHIVAYVESV